MTPKKEKQHQKINRYPYICAVTIFFCWMAYGSYYVNDHFFVAASEQFPDSLIGRISLMPEFELLGKSLYAPWLFGVLVTTSMCGTVYLIVDLLEIKGYFCILLAAGTLVVNRTFLAAHLYWPHETAFSLFFAMVSLWVWKRRWMGGVQKFLICVLSLTLSGLCSRAWMAMLPFAAGILLLMDLFNGKQVLMILAENLECFLIFGGWLLAQQVLPYLLNRFFGVDIMAFAGDGQSDMTLLMLGDAEMELLLRVLFFAAVLLLLCMVQHGGSWHVGILQILMTMILFAQLFAVGMIIWNKGYAGFKMNLMQLAAILVISVLDHSKTDRNKDITLREWLEIITLRVKYGYQVGLDEEKNTNQKEAYKAPLGLWNWKRILLYKIGSVIVFWGLCVFVGVKLIFRQPLPFWIIAAAMVCFFLLNRLEAKSVQEICELNPDDAEWNHTVKVFLEQQLELILTVLLGGMLILNIVLANSVYF